MGSIFCKKKVKSRIDSTNPTSFSGLLNKLILNKFIAMNWDDFKHSFQIDQTYGTCFLWDSVELDSQYEPWVQFVENIPALIERKAVEIKLLPVLNLDFAITGEQKIKIYSLLLYITNAYLFQDYPNVPQELPKNIAVPLYLISKELGIKPAFGNAQNMCNWKLINSDQQHLDIQNLTQRYSFTKQRGEEVFFLLSNLADFRIANILEAGFNINKMLSQHFYSNFNANSTYLQQHFQQNQSDLQQSVQSNIIEEISQITYLKPLLKILLQNEHILIKPVQDFLDLLRKEICEITKSLGVMFECNDPGFFFNKLRHFLQGYARQDVFPKGLYFKGIEKYVIFEGGSGGNSPSFQILERLIGISFEGDLEKIQSSLRLGMIAKHLKLIDFFKQHSVIRCYCLATKSQEVKEAYNNVINSYVQFNLKHSAYITRYIEKEIQKLDSEINLDEVKGTGDIHIKKLKDRFKQVAQFRIIFE